jgi:hypothetical protein
MITNQSSILISTVPPMVLLTLILLFAVSATILLVLSVEAGHYRDVSDWFKCVGSDNPWSRRARRRRRFFPVLALVLPDTRHST